MTKTRKKAREDAAHDAEMAEAGPSSQQSSNPTLQVPVPEDIDLDYLSEILPNIPDFSRVTSDAVAVLYKLVVGLNTDLDGLRRDVDELQAEVEKKDVELDQALQDKESLSKDLEDNVESVHSELEQVKQERDKLGSYHSYAFSLNANSSCSRVFLQRRRTLVSSRKCHTCPTLKHRRAQMWSHSSTALMTVSGRSANS